MDKIKTVAVSYLNTKPLLYGLYQHGSDRYLDIRLAMPSLCAEQLISGEADLGLIPVGALHALDHYEIISDYCIGAVGKVQTVCLFANKPIDQIKRCYLDYQSRTSVELVQLLAREYWKYDWEWIPATEGFEDKIGDDTAAVIIGDRCIPLLKKHPYIYDLAEEWFNWTQLPFVFAVWVATKPIPASVIGDMNKAFRLGIDRIPQLINVLPDNKSDFDLEYYFKYAISYELTEEKRKGLELFLQKINTHATV